MNTVGTDNVRRFSLHTVIEDECRRLKDASYLSETSEYHRTDTKIRGPQLICFLTLLQFNLDRGGEFVAMDELVYSLQKWHRIV